MLDVEGLGREIQCRVGDFEFTGQLECPSLKGAPTDRFVKQAAGADLRRVSVRKHDIAIDWDTRGIDIVSKFDHEREYICIPNGIDLGHCTKTVVAKACEGPNKCDRVLGDELVEVVVYWVRNLTTSSVSPVNQLRSKGNGRTSVSPK